MQIKTLFHTLFSYNGIQLPPNLIPPSVEYLLNDVWRGLVYFVRKAGGYGDIGVYFQDFVWAAFFRARLPPPPSIATADVAQFCTAAPFNALCIGDVDTAQRAWVKSVLQQALQLARSPAASNLPGYGKGEKEELNCDF